MSEPAATHTKAVQDFLAEAEEIVEHLGSELADLADAAERSEFDPDLLNSIFRGAHSLKGLAGMFNFDGVAELAHNMENLLDRLRLGKLNLSPHLITVLFLSHEVLTATVRALASREDKDMTQEIAVCVSRINACLAPPEHQAGTASPGAAELPAHIRTALTEYEEHRLNDNIAKGRALFTVHASLTLDTFDTELTDITVLLKARGEVISTLPGVGENVETAIDFEILFGSTRSHQELQADLERENVSVSLLIPAVTLAAPAAAVDDRAPVCADFLTPAPDETQLTAKSMSRTVRVDIAKLDELMNIVGDLVLANSAIADVTARISSEGPSRSASELGRAAKGLERKLADLQKGVMEIRMVPVGQLYEKMSRIVRKISREQGKQIDLKFIGADTELDKLIVEDLSDPMMHIVRNAIDHGIESGSVRALLGKKERGTIRISSRQKGNHVVIEIEDDGGGIDIAKVRERALQTGLVNDVYAVSDQDALDYIFLPGFSTNETVSEFSGRGVGMDVVKNNISALSGRVDIETRKGEGTRFTLTLPITLALIRALVVRCCGRIYALPITSVLESVIMTDTDVTTVERTEVVQLRGATLPLLRLEHYFDLRRSGDRPEEFYVVVVGAAEKRLGIAVDDLVCQQDIVTKPLGETFRRFRGVSGAADLGDQRTILVLDIVGIVQDSMHLGG